VRGLAHIASGCVTIAIAIAIAYIGFVPIDNGADAFLSRLNFGHPGSTSIHLEGFPLDGPALLIVSIVVALGVLALGFAEVGIGRRALRGAGYFAALSFGIAWCALSLLLASYLGFLLAGTASVCVWWAREWYREMDLAAAKQLAGCKVGPAPLADR
jgi:hypothetical protein